MTNKLKPLALALLCLPALAGAQSMSVYGLMDLSLGKFRDAGPTKENRVQSGNMATSFLGFSGAEELGGTVKAKFALESFLRADTGEAGRFGGDTFWSRAAWVGLDGEFGATVIGRTTNQFFVSTLLFNAFGDSFGFSPAIRQVLTPSTVHPQMLAFLGDTGWSNSILYSSKPSNGFTVNLQGSLGESAPTSRGHNAGASVVYFGDRFGATLAWQKVKQGLDAFTPTIQSTGFRSQDSAQFGASYDLRFVKLYGQYSLVKTRAAVNTQTRVYGLGLSAPVGPGALLAQYGLAKAEQPAGETVNKTLTLGYDYNLSKLTDVYAIVMSDKLTGLATGNTAAAGIRLKF